MKKIIDSNIWIGFFNKDDSTHERSMQIITETIQNQEYCVTDYIIIEVMTILLQKISKDTANVFYHFISEDERCHIIYSSKDIFQKYATFFLENNFKKLSFIDQSLVLLSNSFEIMTFDKNLLKIISNIGNS